MNDTVHPYSHRLLESNTVRPRAISTKDANDEFFCLCPLDAFSVPCSHRSVHEIICGNQKGKRTIKQSLFVNLYDFYGATLGVLTRIALSVAVFFWMLAFSSLFLEKCLVMPHKIWYIFTKYTVATFISIQSERSPHHDRCDLCPLFIG